MVRPAPIIDRQGRLRGQPVGFTSFNENRMRQAQRVAQELKSRIARLEQRRAELERWDAAAQARFEAAFGTTDPAQRDKLLQRIKQEIAHTKQSLAAVADDIRFLAYLQSARDTSSTPR
jgi:hypothetical protein